MLPIVRALPLSTDPRVLVGPDTADDAAVYWLTPSLALVQTVDFFTPVVDDPFDFGRIAAANALSDIYAMGGTPLTALNLVAFPLERLGDAVLREVLAGGMAVAAEAGCAIVGGHSIDDAEPKYGLSVTGTSHPERILRNSTAQDGDLLVLTKPLGVGAIVTAHKRGSVDDTLLSAAVEVMVRLNRSASHAALAGGAHAATDVTGFGLLGHLHSLARESGLAAEVDASAIPHIAGVEELLAQDMGVSSGSVQNRIYAEGFATYSVAVPDWRRRLCTDATTSGGLLVAMPPGCESEITDGVLIGRLFSTRSPGAIRVL
jgi:selenide,water dikinase